MKQNLAMTVRFDIAYVIEIERIHKIRHVLAAPGRQCLGVHSFIPLGRSPFLNKLNV